MDNYLLSIAFMFFLGSSLGSAANIVPQTCMKLSKFSGGDVKYKFCVNAFELDPRSSKAGVAELGAISFDLDVTKVQSMSSILTTMLKNPKLNPVTKEDLRACLEFFDTSIDYLHTGRKSFEQRDYGSANIEASGALTSFDHCRQEFKETGQVYPLAMEGKELFDLIVMSLTFTHYLR